MKKRDESNMWLYKVFVVLFAMAIGIAMMPTLSTRVQDEQTIINANVLITDGQGHGSGVYLGNGIILTASHCLGIENACIIDSKGNIYEILEEIYCGDLTEDIGFIRINAKADIPAITNFGKMPKVMDTAYICGTPIDMFLFSNLTTGTITKVGIFFPGWWDNVLMADTAAYPGNSGGGVYNKNFELIGILVGGYTGYDNLSIIEPIEDILKMMELEL